MTNKEGFSFIELLVVVSITGILMSLGFYGYNRLMIKSSIEADTRRILAMTNRARQYSFTRKEILSLNLNGRKVTVADLSGNVYDDFAMDTKNDFLSVGSDPIVFRDGFSSAGLLRARRRGYGAEYDCVLYESSRIRAGRYDGVNCNVR